MIDMFMDEIDYVRLNALTSLCKIGNRASLVFDTEQLQIALGVLEDADRDVRESAHRMLQYDLTFILLTACRIVHGAAKLTNSNSLCTL